ncbi:hypothetical protein [Paenibacillus mucilaginosus]|uniref:Bulb-type lectin domain-containing protein n=1 Tax=Paenibacillus mucilaginosus 3016 TaxID=1116391 RepID=H6NA50_9BACL|nr:hypothetical protein [Paenibacillus mucilaginosus]AFC28894.1 hypothetical protein PM3016_1992 [Paenibacillus mucilaginosus 3016]MCG7213382.1 hypothetical protein [Paenibacillus mucilaginosus]WDM29470.1 hypothetical protein KCX80_10065 [Paenibacillus mucilaginosus]WFA17647.1 hypothetical protein ERY13_10340 [Paenibacillus mucilaginosus]
MKKFTLILSAALMLQFSIVSAAFAKNTLVNGETLRKGQTLQSNNGVYSLQFKTDGNLVLYKNNTTMLWQSGTAGARKYLTTFQGFQFYTYPEILELYNGSIQIIDDVTYYAFWKSDNKAFSTMWYGQGNVPTNLYGDRLVVQDDGNLVLYNTSASSSPYPVWASHTGGQ